WAYAATRTPTTAAGLATVVHGLSGDDHASVHVPSMAVSNASVKAAAVAIYDEAEGRAFWVSDPAVDPWRVTTTLTHTTGRTWSAVTRITTSSGRPIAHHRVGLVPGNVTDAPGTEHVATTDGTGTVRTTWTQE